MVERVSGPFRGHYIATYACPVGEGAEFHGFAKVCRVAPPSYWEATDVVQKLSAPAWTPTAQAAIDAAEEVARMFVANRVRAL